MKNILILTLLASIALTGCSSAGKKSNSKPGKVEKEKAVPTTKSEDYITYVSASKVGLAASDCPKGSEGWKSLGWQRLLKAGRACFAYNEMTKMQEIGYHLAERDSDLPWGPYFLSLYQENKGALTTALWYVELAKKKSAQDPLIEYQRARLQYLSGNTAEAVEVIEGLVKKHPDMLEANLFIGQVYAASGRYDDAITYLRKYLQVFPQETKALLGVARSYDEQNKYDMAIPVYQKLVFIDPSNWQARLRIAQLSEKTNDSKHLALAGYENLLNYIKTSKVKIDLPLDVEAKIREIKEELGQKVSLRQPSGKAAVRK